MYIPMLLLSPILEIKLFFFFFFFSFLIFLLTQLLFSNIYIGVLSFTAFLNYFSYHKSPKLSMSVCLSVLREFNGWGEQSVCTGTVAVACSVFQLNYN